GSEQVRYTVLSLRARLSEIPYSRGGSRTVSWNAKDTDEDYEPVYAGKSVGFILDAIFSGAETEINEQIPGFTYDSGSALAIEYVSARLALNSTNVEEAINLVLNAAPSWRLRTTYQNGSLHFSFVNLNDVSASTLTIGADSVISSGISSDVRDSATAVVYGGFGGVIDTMVELEEEWDEDLEADWTPPKGAEEGQIPTRDADGQIVPTVEDDYTLVFRRWSVPAAVTGLIMGERGRGWGPPKAFARTMHGSWSLSGAR
ncbi:unnamed protein product, partial [marine sediment metagenome]